MAQWLSGLWCWIYHVCLGFKSFEWQNILHLDCHGLDWIPFEILRSKNKGWIDPMGLTFPRMDQSNELQFLQPEPSAERNSAYEEDFNGEDRVSKRSFSPSESPESKRRKFDDSLYAWKIQEEIAPPALSANLERTRTMVQNYTADLRHALWSLQSAGSLPPFPKSEWKHVLSGTAVNLDAVFSGLFSSITDDKITTSIGDFDLSVGSSKPSKIIQTHGDWTIAWNATSSAIICAFPHRASEI